jgi:hypothetical protein
MNVEIGTEATQFPEKEYINGIFVAVCKPQSKITVCILLKRNMPGFQPPASLLPA